jgi:hypothetical protein
MMKNPNVQSVVKVVTIAGSAVLVLNSAMSLTRVKDVKSAVMPVVSILVGVAAFNYAMAKTPQIKKA